MVIIRYLMLEVEKKKNALAEKLHAKDAVISSLLSTAWIQDKWFTYPKSEGKFLCLVQKELIKTPNCTPTIKTCSQWSNSSRAISAIPIKIYIYISKTNYGEKKSVHKSLKVS